MHRYLTSSIISSSSRWLFLSGFLCTCPIRRLKISPLPKRLDRKYSCKSIDVVNGLPKSTRRSNKPKVTCNKFEHSHIIWWEEKMQTCKKPSTMQLVKRLTDSNLLGIDSSLRNGSLKEGTLNSELLHFKSRFPREVLLCRVGDFYEAIGFDACVLVEHAGLNPFGGLRSDSIPRAGCPVVNLRQTLDDLTRGGFSVCIVEEVQGPSQARSRKGRFISGHAHPGSPYVFGLAGVDDDVDFPEPMPVVGISRSVKGYCMMSVFETMKTFSVGDGLTEEAIVTKLRTCRFHHLFLHTSLRHNSSGTSRWGEYGEGGLLWSECSGKPFEWFDGVPVEELLFKVRDIYGLDEEATFRNVTLSSSEKRPQPLYLGTATQIGVVPTDGIPSLLKVLLPSNCVGLPVLYIRDLLLNPPTFVTASAIQQTCRIMSSLTCSIPEFTCVSAAKLVKLLELREANHIEFCRIKNVADDILQMHLNSDLSAILHMLLEPTLVATGLTVEYDILVTECEQISERISEIISLGGERGQELSCFELIPREFFEDMESSWKGRVKRIHAEEVYTKVERAAQCLSTALKEDFLPIVLRVKSVISPLGGPRGEICYAREHDAVWFKGKRFMPSVWANTHGEEQIKQLRPATDSKGKKVGEEWFTTSKVEEELRRYHEACDNAKAKILELLKDLSTEMQVKINILVFSSMLLVIAKALFSHVSEGRRREWAFPSLYEFHNFKARSSEVDDKMELNGLSPYWFDIAQGTAVQNTVKMQSLFILTGPNGGGKSSLLRALCAAALLGICGLMVPVESANIPHFDSVMLHMKAYDSPADGKSSFQIEMSEIRSVVTGATSRSLVLLDEICRGTETAKGTCIAGSIIETLDQVGCLGIVSTHLHSIFDLPLATKMTVNKAMGTKIVNGHIRPTWKLVDGVCRESLAFETAQKEGIPETVIRRAEELYLSINAKSIRAEKVSHKYDPKELGQELDSLSTSLGSMQILQKEVGDAVTIICQKKLIELYKKKSVSELVEVTCVTIGVREQPPPSTVGTSCIYVLFRPDKKLYVGQTDDLVGRVRAHRSKEGMKSSLFLYVIVPGKSIASQLETLLINQLPLQGFRLANKADGRHRNFGTTSTLALETPSLHQ